MDGGLYDSASAISSPFDNIQCDQKDDISESEKGKTLYILHQCQTRQPCCALCMSDVSPDCCVDPDSNPMHIETQKHNPKYSVD